jgi:hypothetical protein
MRFWTKWLKKEVMGAAAVGIHCAAIVVSGSSDKLPHELDQIISGSEVLHTYLEKVMPNFKVALGQIAMDVHTAMGHSIPQRASGQTDQPPEPVRKQEYQAK